MFELKGILEILDDTITLFIHQNLGLLSLTLGENGAVPEAGAKESHTEESSE